VQLHELQIKNKLKRRKRVGRGGKRGTYSGRGVKGQKARAGRKMQPSMRELIKRYPKLRGYRYVRLKSSSAVLNLDILERVFQNGDKITPAVLVEKKIIRRSEGRTPSVKILGRGEITKKVNISGCQASKSAKEKIEKAGGKIKLRSQISNLKTTS